jgi:SAM-dependent methyltransferase
MNPLQPENRSCGDEGVATARNSGFRVQPESDPAARLYQSASGRAYHEHKRALRPEALPWVMALRAEKFQRHVRPEDVVFELGVGSGWNLGRLRCARRIGCDAAGFLEDRVSALGIEFVPDAAVVPDATAQVAICHQTLEHLLEPAKALWQLARILKPDGLLILHAPWERERRYARYRAGEPNHHLYNWNAQNLGNLAGLCPFTIETIATRRYGYDRAAANLAVRLGVGERGFRLIRAGLILLRPLREVELIARRKPD